MERLTLAEAIRKGATETVPAKRSFLYHYDGQGTYAACAIGAAAWANGIQTTIAPELCIAVCFHYPELQQQEVIHPVTLEPSLLWPTIVQLNDEHHWTREAIADWLDAQTLDLTPVPVGHEVEA